MNKKLFVSSILINTLLLMLSFYVFVAPAILIIFNYPISVIPIGFFIILNHYFLYHPFPSSNLMIKYIEYLIYIITYILGIFQWYYIIYIFRKVRFKNFILAISICTIILPILAISIHYHNKNIKYHHIDLARQETKDE